MRRALACALLFFSYNGAARVRGQEGGHIHSPVPYQVVQRQAFVPEHAHEHEPGGPRLGHGFVPIAAEFPGPATATARFEFRVVPLKDAFGRGTDWAALESPRVEGGKVSARVRVPAGGWYRLEVRGVGGDRVTGTAKVEPFGVGEVFVIAGQSYAAGANDALLRVDDPEGRVAAFDAKGKTWRVAHDPQPGVGDGGTIWPAFGNTLLPMVRVPIGLVNVASGGTSSRQWLPDTPLYKNLDGAGKSVGRFRAVLWQQGESDVIEKVSTDTYVANLKEVRSRLASEWGFEPPWLLAKSTLHPTVYNDPTHEGMIRTAIDRLWTVPGFRPGPDTDILGGENRGGPQSRRHFSAIGQQRAGVLWFATVWPEVYREAPHLKTP